MAVKESAFLLKVRGKVFYNEELSCIGWQYISSRVVFIKLELK